MICRLASKAYGSGLPPNGGLRMERRGRRACRGAPREASDFEARNLLLHAELFSFLRARMSRSSMLGLRCACSTRSERFACFFFKFLKMGAKRHRWSSSRIVVNVLRQPRIVSRVTPFNGLDISIAIYRPSGQGQLGAISQDRLNPGRVAFAILQIASAPSWQDNRRQQPERRPSRPCAPAGRRGPRPAPPATAAGARRSSRTRQAPPERPAVLSTCWISVSQPARLQARARDPRPRPRRGRVPPSATPPARHRCAAVPAPARK